MSDGPTNCAAKERWEKKGEVRKEEALVDDIVDMFICKINLRQHVRDFIHLVRYYEEYR